ncbi:hypothetical protein H70357_03585 [Paenibacillus sp. FSL H7-0357]|uniref:hypothetical protein n=1 Tax=Paenibacillus sp. FSL H7-0357 TaxID=1536774 RepID=UPI0004F79862|nr:hypothetical protein [Paenibacillus sp. FSL H7-0357]AIQ15879.1 hypothetical protein H70357_03585 [Paenibacillus sp. FSL H7-0357]
MRKKNNKKQFLSENKPLIIEWLFILSILLVLVGIILYHTPVGFGRLVNSWNHEWASNWFGLFAIYWIEIVLLMFIWDLFWFRLAGLVETMYDELSHLWIKKKWLLIKLIRFKYGFDKLRFRMRIAFYFGGGKSRQELIDYVGYPTIVELLKSVFYIIIGRTSILAGIFTVLTFDSSSFDVVQNEAINLWNESTTFLWDNFTKLSAVVVLVLLVFLGYFVSRQGVIRRAIAQANRKKLEEIVQMHRKLSHIIIGIILTGSKNVEYAINCYDLLVEFWAHKIQPDTSVAARRKWAHQRYKDSKDFRFEDISELELFLEELDKLKLADNADISRWFWRSKYELISLFVLSSTSLKIDQINRLLFTKKGFEDMNKIPENYFASSDGVEEFDADIIQAEVDEYKKYTLESYIIEGIELIFILYRYIKVIETMLHIDSDKPGRGLRAFTNKE